jgi:hypothetical protein
MLAYPIRKSEISAKPVLRELSVLKRPFQGTNFRVSQEQWREIQSLIEYGPVEKIRAAERDETATGTFDSESINDARDFTIATIVRRRGQPAFRQRLLRIYGGRCAITG